MATCWVDAGGLPEAECLLDELDNVCHGVSLDVQMWVFVKNAFHWGANHILKT